MGRARWALGDPAAVRRDQASNKTTLVFTNTRFLAEFIFQLLWDVNEDNLPIGIHHGSLAARRRGARLKGAMARGELRALVCTASLDLGIDWGDIDCVVQMGAPKGSSRLLQRIGRANHRLDHALVARSSSPAIASNSLRPPPPRMRLMRASVMARIFGLAGSTCWHSM